MNSEEHDHHMNKKMHEIMEHYDRKGMHEKLRMHDAKLEHMHAGNHKYMVKSAKELEDELKRR